MRLLRTVAAIISVAVSARTVHEDNLEDYIPVYAAYGNLTRIARAASMRMAIETHHQMEAEGLSRASDKAAFRAVRRAANCIFPLDVLILQDLTGSHQGDFRDTIVKTLPSMSATLPMTHPGSRFSLVTYRDKPINELGELDDDCFTVQTLNAEDPIEFKPFLDADDATGGWDYPENQYGALMAILKSPKTINWRTNPLATPLIVHITDSEPHFEGDGRQSKYPQLGPWGSSYDEDKAEDYCNNRYYPSPLTVREALLEEGVLLSTIIVRPEWEKGRALAAWKWFNEYIGNHEGLLQTLDDSMDNWFGELSEILEKVAGIECGDEETTSTVAPTEQPDESQEPGGNLSPLTRPPRPSTAPVTQPTSTTSAGQTEECSCPEGEEGCCEQQPEVLIAILKRPKVLDVHLQGYADSPSM